MFTLSITEKGGETSHLQFDQPEVSIGRTQGNDVVLPKSNISKRHARIINNNGSFVVVDAKSTNGTYINGNRIDAPYDLSGGDKIFVGDFTLEIQVAEEEKKKAAPPPPPAEEATPAPAKKSPPPAPKEEDEVLADDAWGGDDAMDGDWDEDWGGEPEKENTATRSEDVVDELLGGGAKKVKLASEHTEDLEFDAPAPAMPMGQPVAPEPTPVPKNAKGAKAAKSGKSAARDVKKTQPIKRKVAPESDDLSLAARMVHERLLRSLDLRRMDLESMDDEELKNRTQEAVSEIIAAMDDADELPRAVDHKVLMACVMDEALGLGPIQDLLHDESVSEIMVNGAKQVFVERDGTLQLTDRAFSSDQAVLGVIERIVAPIGRRIDESSPMVDARLKDGSRVNAIIPPLALSGPTLTIRKFTAEPLTVDDLVMFGSMSAEMAEFLETCVKARKNIIISGGTGSGKTTTLNVLSSYISNHERILTIEDAAELKLDQQHVVSLEARPPNIEGRGAVPIRDLVRNALRMRPDRIVVGECRGGEALDMLQAMNTGHDGSLTTVHANSPRDALSRLETMVLMSGMELPMRAIRDQISSAVDIVVQQIRFADGSRRLTAISEVTGMEGDVISMQDIFTFEQEGFDENHKVKGQHKATGFVPRFYEDLRAMGIEANMAIFQ